MSEKKSQRTPYSNVQIVIMANRPAFTRESLGDSGLFGSIPIANKPILAHLLEQFEKNNFTNISLVCLCMDAQGYTELLIKLNINNVRIIPVEGVMTTCDIIRNKIGSDNHIFIFPIDLITSQNLTAIYDFHVYSQSLITILTTKFTVEPNELKNAPGLQNIQQLSSQGRRYFVYDQNDPTKLLSLLSDAAIRFDDLDLTLKRGTIDHDESSDSIYSSEGGVDSIDDSMELDPSLLEGFRSLIIDCSQQPTNAYLLSPACIQILRENNDIHSIESEFIPFLCQDYADSAALSSNLQYNQQQSPHSSIFCFGDKEFAYRVADYSTLFIANLKCATGRLREFSPFAKFIRTSQDGSAMGYYLDESEIKVPPTFKFTPYCVYGNNFNSAEDVTITRSVIGNHCKLGKNVKIVNSILMDHVTIDEGAEIQNSLIGPESVIHANSKFRHCVILPRFSSKKPVNKNACFVQTGNE